MTKKAGKASKKQVVQKLADPQRLQAAFTGIEDLRQVLMPLVTGAADARRGLMQWTHQVGLKALQRIFLDDAERIAGPRGSTCRTARTTTGARRRRRWSSGDVG